MKIAFILLSFLTSSAFGCNFSEDLQAFITDARRLGQYDELVRNHQNDSGQTPARSTYFFAFTEPIQIDHEQEVRSNDERLERLTMHVLWRKEQVMLCASEANLASCELALDDLWSASQLKLKDPYEIVNNTQAAVYRLNKIALDNAILKTRLHCR